MPRGNFKRICKLQLGEPAPEPQCSKVFANIRIVLRRRRPQKCGHALNRLVAFTEPSPVARS